MLGDLGRDPSQLDRQLYGVDIHDESLERSATAFKDGALDAHLVESHLCAVPPPGRPGARFRHHGGGRRLVRREHMFRS